MSYLDDHLLAGERIVYRAHLHWTIFGASILVVLLGIALAIVLQLFDPQYWYLGAVLAGIAVTDKRVLAKHGFIQRESIETLLSKVEAIEVDQGILGRMMGFGSVNLTGTGGTQESFPRIAQPLEFRRQIQSQIVAQEERRGLPPSGSVASDAAAGRVERECPYCAEPILARARVCKHCGRDVVPVAG
jgi:uncharacterized membrane protein YdbT with pleckstrin-like domain